MEGDIFEFIFELVGGIFELLAGLSETPNSNITATPLSIPFTFADVCFFVFQIASMGYLGAFVMWYANGGRKAFSDYLIFKKHGFQPYIYGWTSAVVLVVFIGFMTKLSIQF